MNRKTTLNFNIMFIHMKDENTKRFQEIYRGDV